MAKTKTAQAPPRGGSGMGVSNQGDFLEEAAFVLRSSQVLLL